MAPKKAQQGPQAPPRRSARIAARPPIAPVAQPAAVFKPRKPRKPAVKRAEPAALTRKGRSRKKPAKAAGQAPRENAQDRSEGDASEGGLVSSNANDNEDHGNPPEASAQAGAGPEPVREPPDPPRKPQDPRAFAQQLGFDYGQQGIPPGHWNFYDTLGEGGFGHAGLWVQCDRQGRITDRIVVKEAYQKDSEWSSRLNWRKGEIGGLPREIWLQQLMTDSVLLPHVRNVVQYLGHVVYPQHKMFRLYSEYCPHGDLGELISEHHKLRSQEEQGSPILAKDGEPLEYMIPERFIWSVFHALAQVSCFMSYGCLRVPSGPLSRHQDWPGARLDEIVHRDIKPFNVFLASPDPNMWPRMPTPKLSDWGLAVHLTADYNGDTTDRQHIVGIGTEGYRPPEQVRVEREANGEQVEVTYLSDIWSIGRLILCMMNLERDDEVHECERLHGYRRPPMNDVALKYYSEDLIELVESCLHGHPLSRQTPSQLYQKTQRMIGAGADENPPRVPMQHTSLMEDELLLYKADISLGFARHIL